MRFAFSTALCLAIMVNSMSAALANTVTLSVPVQISNFPSGYGVLVTCHVLSTAINSVAQYHALSGSPVVGAVGKAPVIASGAGAIFPSAGGGSANTTVSVEASILSSDVGNVRGYYCYLNVDPSSGVSTIGDVPRLPGAPYTPEVAGSVVNLVPSRGAVPIIPH